MEQNTISYVASYRQNPRDHDSGQSSGIILWHLTGIFDQTNLLCIVNGEVNEFAILDNFQLLS